MKIHKYNMGGEMGEPTNRDMRESDRASRESFRMARPERRMQREHEDVDRLLSSLEGYDPEDQEKREMMKKIMAMVGGAATLPVGAAAWGSLLRARNEVAGNKDPIYGGDGRLNLSPLERILMQIFGPGQNINDQ